MSAGPTRQPLGVQGTGVNELLRPLDVGVTAAGEILVADSGNHRLVQVDDAGGSNWASFGTEGRPPAGDPAVGKFDTPTSIIGLADGSIVTADPASGRIVSVSSIDGADWTSFGLSNTEATTLSGPVGVSAEGSVVYVSEIGARRLSSYPAFPTDAPERVADTTWDVPLRAPTALSAYASERLLVLDVALARLVALHQQAGIWKLTASVNLRRVGIEQPTGVCKVTP